MHALGNVDIALKIRIESTFSPRHGCVQRMVIKIRLVRVRKKKINIKEVTLELFILQINRIYNNVSKI